MARTGLSSSTQSSRHSGNSVDWPRSAPAMNRFIAHHRKSRAESSPTRSFHAARVKRVEQRWRAHHRRGCVGGGTATEAIAQHAALLSPAPAATAVLGTHLLRLLRSEVQYRHARLYALLSTRQQGTCTESRSVKMGDIEQRVLSAIERHLFTPEMVAAASGCLRRGVRPVAG